MNWPVVNTSGWQRTGHMLILVNTRYKVTLCNEVQCDWGRKTHPCALDMQALSYCFPLYILWYIWDAYFWDPRKDKYNLLFKWCHEEHFQYKQLSWLERKLLCFNVPLVADVNTQVFLTVAQQHHNLMHKHKIHLMRSQVWLFYTGFKHSLPKHIYNALGFGVCF